MTNTPTPVLAEPVTSGLTAVDPKVISNRYTIIDFLGEGGMGKVFLALDPSIDRKVAIKVLPFGDFEQEHVSRFQQEARAAARLNHPGIIKALDFGLSEKHEPYLVMEYVDGKTMDSILRTRGQLTIEEFKVVFKQITQAVCHAHNEGIVHRDLKPSNIMIRYDESGVHTYVLDFGIAKIVNDRESLNQTRTGQIIGSPRYISPEQICAIPIDGRSDIYSLGCVMFEALTGQPPFKGKNAMETIQMHLNDEPPSLSSRVDVQFSAELENLIAKTLAKDINQRYQSMFEVSEAIENLNAIDALKISAVEPPSNVENQVTLSGSQQGARKLANVAMIVVTVTALALISYLTYQLFQLIVDANTSQAQPPPLSKKEVTQLNEDKQSELYDLYEKGIDTRESGLELLHRCNIKELKETKILRLSHISSAADLQNLPLCINLEDLDLSMSTIITDNELGKLSQLKRLKTLRLSQTAVTPSGLKKAFGGRTDLVVNVYACKEFAGMNLSKLSQSIGVKFVDKE